MHTHRERYICERGEGGGGQQVVRCGKNGLWRQRKRFFSLLYKSHFAIFLLLQRCRLSGLTKAERNFGPFLSMKPFQLISLLTQKAKVAGKRWHVMGCLFAPKQARVERFEGRLGSGPWSSYIVIHRQMTHELVC